MPLSIFFTCTFCAVKPYNESRDNWIAILSSALLILVFVSSSFMKYNQLLAEESEVYDLVGTDILMIMAYGSVIVLFLWWVYHQKDVLLRSTVTMAKNTLKGKSSVGGSSLGDEDDEEDFEDKERKSKAKKKGVKKSHLARAETFKKKFKAKGGLKGGGGNIAAKQQARGVDKDEDDQGDGGSLEMSEIKAAVDNDDKTENENKKEMQEQEQEQELEQKQESSFNLIVTRTLKGELKTWWFARSTRRASEEEVLTRMIYF
ncbi:hypothetical protein TrLO_g7352 [Triparma laevis f. longispina]|nr:hypothetical protein TrLO_g7352 [Triparma laevis f. longispina]